MVTVEQNPYKSIVVESENGSITISEGDKIQFCLESGEIRKGILTKLMGKNEKLKIQILPTEKECEEIWSVLQMQDGSLKLLENDDKIKEKEE